MKKWISLILAIILLCSECFAISPYTGDVNDDGVISIIDIAKTRAHIIGDIKLDAKEAQSADINKDDIVDIIDVIFMRSSVINESGALYTTDERQTKSFSLKNIPVFSDSPYCIVNDNVPYFDESEFTTTSYEFYSDLDELGRCGECIACIGIDIMPTEERGYIGMIKPTGWHLDKYDFVDGKYLYNRCHLIGYQLAGENANEKNLITGTRYLNIQGMLPFENKVAAYVKTTNNHVLYRVTPIFEGDNLLANGVLMEAYSVEDNGEGICFNVFCYNAQPGVSIDYKTGDSQSNPSVTTTTTTTTPTSTSTTSSEEQTAKYILNTSSMKIHTPSCSSVSKIADKNKGTYDGDISDLIAQGYTPCKICNPT